MASASSEEGDDRRRFSICLVTNGDWEYGIASRVLPPFLSVEDSSSRSYFD